MTEETKDLQVSVEQETAPADVMGFDLAKVAEDAEKQIEARVKIKQMILRITTKRDWIKMGDSSYLTVAGCQKVAGLFGVSWQIDEPVRHELPNGHFTWEYHGTFTLRSGTSIQEMGTRSSKDDVFSKAYNKQIPPEMIDEAKVKKSAYTNCIGRGLSAMLGLRGWGWDEVQDAGVKTAGLEVGFKNKGEAPKQQSPAPPSETPVQPPSEGKKSAPASPEGQENQAPEDESPADKRARLMHELDEILVKRTEGDDNAYFDELEKITGFTGQNGNKVKGVRDIDKLSNARLQVVLNRIGKGEL